MKHSLSLASAALLGACSMLIEVGDGIDRELESQTPSGGGTSPDASAPDAPDSSRGGSLGVAGRGGSGGTSDGGDAGLRDAGDGGPAGAPTRPFDLAFIENPDESEATLQLVSATAALLPGASGDASRWRRALVPADRAGDVLDFAWAPGGERIAVRYDAVQGVRIAFFAAPEWRELTLDAAGSPALLPDLTATANYRWSPDGRALALELASDEGPFIGGYVIDEESAIGLEPVAFTGPIETMEWLSPSSLFVIQPESEEPEVIALPYASGAFGSPEALLAIGLFFPLELRRVPGGVVAASDDPENFIFFWPESPERGVETAFRPAAYLSNTTSLVAEPNESAGMLVYSIADSSQPLDTVPNCPIVLAWANGPDPSSLAGSKLACLSVQDGAASLAIHSYDAAGERTSLPLADATLSASFGDTAWETHARAFSPGGDYLALATVENDVLIDLRGAAPELQSSAAVAGNSARGFSPSGRYLLEQRGRSIAFVVLSPAEGAPSVRFELPAAANELEACTSAHHSTNWCGAPSAARRAAGRWSLESDLAALLAANEGLVVLGPTEDTAGVTRVSVSTCGASCVTQYEFGQ
jgi:hypothetical protein